MKINSHRRQGSGRRSIRGFTMVEIMIVLGIVGILLAISVPSYMAARTKSRVQKAKGDLEIIASAIRQLAWDTGRYPNGYLKTSASGMNNEVENMEPSSAGLLSAILTTYPNWKGPYLRSLKRDPWGTRYFFDPDYQVAGATRAVVGSYGPNRVGPNNYDSDNIYVIIK